MRRGALQTNVLGPTQAVKQVITTVDIVIPVFNEEDRLPRSLEILRVFLSADFLHAWRVIIADNGSRDATRLIAEDFCKSHERFYYFRTELAGRGRTVKTVWMQSTADIVCYMDVDLSTNLKYLSLLIEGIRTGYDVAIGSRLMQASRIKRSIKREILSRAYNALVWILFFNKFSDAQCGFKAIRREVFGKLAPFIEDTGWFFDSEMLLLAEKNGYRIFEIPVEWTEDLDSRVKIFKTAWGDIKGLLRVRVNGMHKREIAGEPCA